MRIRNQIILPNLKRKSLPEIQYQRIDENNVRIGTKWFKFKQAQIGWHMVNLHPIEREPAGVTIFEDGAKRFISNSWYLDEEIERL